jgi:hypothetical protein
MHHFIYPSKDTYISSKTPDKNYGVDEILQIGTRNAPRRVWKTTKAYSYTASLFNPYTPTLFTGQFTGSLTGSHASGSLSGSYTGSLIEFTGCLYGTASGYDIRNDPHWTTETFKQIDRSLIQFDLTAISRSISAGEIADPRFKLRMIVTDELDVPINYKVYALAVSQSWEMGNGYFSDGGSSNGVSWDFRDEDDGERWYTPQLSQSAHVDVNFIDNLNLATASFTYGGGTWHSSSAVYIASQSFSNQQSDIEMDVTDIALRWISGSIPNEGLLILHSDELQTTGSGFILKFFSRESNTIYSPHLDAMWNDAVIVTGSFGTGSTSNSTVSAGITASSAANSTFSMIMGVSGSFSGSITYTLDANTSASGFISAMGLTGNLDEAPIFGAITGSFGTSSYAATSSAGGIYQYNSITASFVDGPFSGSTFMGNYRNNRVENCFLTGSWLNDVVEDATVYIPLPSTFAPYAYAQVNSDYLSGSALGQYTVLNSTSASFTGQFVNGVTTGGNLYLQLTGSIVTQSYTTTTVTEITSSALDPLDISRPYAVVLNTLRPIYRSGDVVKIGVFAREQFGLKTFAKATQQESHLTPKYLPTSSYYAIKDNETGEIMMDFDSYTQLSCEYPYGNYFVLDTSGLPQERFYRILIRIDDGDEVQTVDSGKVFKVVRGSSWNS